jgi:hypothetical protein
MTAIYEVLVWRSQHPALVLYRPKRMATETNTSSLTGASAPHPAPEAEEIYRRWLQFLDEEFAKHCAPERRAEIVRDQLYQLYLGRPHGGKLNLTLTSELPGNVVSLSLDPANVTMEAEHFSDVDMERFAERKPLIWFWQMFDRSPLGLNHWLGVRFRCMLGQHIFKKIGKGVRFHVNVRFIYGYNLVIEDNCRIRRNVLLDDSGGELVIPEGTVVDWGSTYPPPDKG